MPSAPVQPSLSRIRASLKRHHLVALGLLGVLLMSGCGRKPSDVDAPAGAVNHTYPPVSP